MFHKATNFNQCLSTWADKTPPNVSVSGIFSESGCPKKDAYANVSPWCQFGSEQCYGSGPSTSAQSASPTSAPRASPPLAPSTPPTKKTEENIQKKVKNKFKRERKSCGSSICQQSIVVISSVWMLHY